MPLERFLVELDPESGAGREVQVPIGQLGPDRGYRPPEKTLGGEPVGNAGVAGAAQRLRDVTGGGDANRAVESA
jgi:hypothetical protein